MAQCGGGFRNKFGGGRSYGGGRGGGRGYGGGRGGGKQTQIFKKSQTQLSNFREITFFFRQIGRGGGGGYHKRY